MWCGSPCIQVVYRETKIHENWKTTWVLLTEILGRMKGHSLNQIYVKNLFDASWILLSSLIEAEWRIYEVKKSACLKFSGTPWIWNECWFGNMYSIFGNMYSIFGNMYSIFGKMYSILKERERSYTAQHIKSDFLDLFKQGVQLNNVKSAGIRLQGVPLNNVKSARIRLQAVPLNTFTNCTKEHSRMLDARLSNSISRIVSTDSSLEIIFSTM